jgi:hypothetical protein
MGLLAMPSLVSAGFVQFCSGLLQVSIGCTHVKLVMRHLLTGLPFEDSEHSDQRGTALVATLWEIQPAVITFL